MKHQSYTYIIKDYFPRRHFKTVFFLFIFLLLSCVLFSVSAEDFWQQQLEDAKSEFENNESLISSYRLAVSRANTGKLWETLEMIDEFKDEFNLEELEEEISSELRLVELGSENLLYLNYAAFYHSMKEDFERSLKFFDKIIEVEENNIWPYIYKAIILLEEKGEYSQSSKVLQEAKEIEQNDYTHILQAYVYYKQGDYLRAANSMRRGRKTWEEIEERL